MRIPVEAVIGTLQSEIANIPRGNVNAGTKSFNIKTSGNYKNHHEIKNTVVYSANNKNIVLGDVADVYLSFEDETHITRLNGYRSVFVTAAQKQGENITKIQKYISKPLPISKNDYLLISIWYIISIRPTM